MDGVNYFLFNPRASPTRLTAKWAPACSLAHLTVLAGQKGERWHALPARSHLQWPCIICLEKSERAIRILKRLTFTWKVVVCVCVFSAYLITVFTTFHFGFPPLPSNAQTVPTCLLAVRFRLPVFAGSRLPLTERGEGWSGKNRKQGKRKQTTTTRKRLTVEVSGYSLMLTEWSVKTGAECSSVMKDWVARRDSMFQIACSDRREQTERQESHRDNVVWRSRGTRCFEG